MLEIYKNTCCVDKVYVAPLSWPLYGDDNVERWETGFLPVKGFIYACTGFSHGLEECLFQCIFINGFCVLKYLTVPRIEDQRGKYPFIYK